ncbi:hypothetical protein D3C87_529840 [compost metagenome]
MKKILFSLIASSAIFYSVNAQTKISFEATEGFAVGNLAGQNGWDASTTSFKVSTNRASDGVRSLFAQNDNSEDWTGAFVTIPNYSKTEVSADARLDGYDSDYAVGLYNADGDVVADFWFTYQSEFIVVFDPELEEYAETTAEWVSGTWYSLKAVVDQSTNKLNYYVNNQLVYTTNLVASDFSILDISLDNYGDSFNVDNIQVKDATLATTEVSKKDIFRVYPNPTVDVVNFDVAGKVNSVEVYDAAGKLVKTAKDGTKSLNVSALSKGSYVVKVQTENGSHTQKLIKK